MKKGPFDHSSEAPYIFGSAPAAVPGAAAASLLPSLLVRASLPISPCKLGDQYWMTLLARLLKPVWRTMVPDAAAMVRSPNGSIATVWVCLNGMSQRPKKKLPNAPVTPTPLLRLAKLLVPPLVSSALNAVSSWPQAFTPPPISFSARMPRSDELSETREREDIGVVPPCDSTCSTVR